MVIESVIIQLIFAHFDLACKWRIDLGQIKHCRSTTTTFIQNQKLKNTMIFFQKALLLR